MKKIYLFFLFNLIFYSHLIYSMEKSYKEADESVVNELTYLCKQKKEQFLQEDLSKVTSESEEEKRKIKHKQFVQELLRGRSDLSHICIDHTWGQLYIQLVDCVEAVRSWEYIIGGKPTNFPKDTKRIKEFNELFSKKTLTNNISVHLSRKHRSWGEYDKRDYNFYNTHINLKPWTDFCFNLMPWPNRHPYIFAATSSIATGLGVYWAMRKGYIS